MNQKNVDAILRILEETGTDNYFAEPRVAAELLAEYGLLAPSALTDNDVIGGYPFDASHLVAELERIAKGEG